MRKSVGAVRLAGLCCLGAALASCSESGSANTSPGADPGRPVVHGVNYPVTFFAERIAATHADVRFLAPADGDPAFWEPGDSDIGKLQSADLILLNGATYAKWLGHVSVPTSTTIDTSIAFTDDYITIEETGTHSHGTDGDHSHAGTAFTTWIDMRQARRQAEAVRDALVRVHPHGADDFDRNTESLLSEIDQLDADLEAVAATIGDQPLMASHPVYQYLARRYELDIESVMWEPETVPGDDDMANLQAILEDHAAVWMIWEGDPDPESVSKLEAIGVQSVVFDPCGNRPEGEDWLSVMQRNVENLKAIGN